MLQRGAMNFAHGVVWSLSSAVAYQDEKEIAWNDANVLLWMTSAAFLSSGAVRSRQHICIYTHLRAAILCATCSVIMGSGLL